MNKTVIVSKDGSGNFVSINDAVGAAPNNSRKSDGYYLIYVAAGVYEECFHSEEQEVRDDDLRWH